MKKIIFLVAMLVIGMSSYAAEKKLTIYLKDSSNFIKTTYSILELEEGGCEVTVNIVHYAYGPNGAYVTSIETYTLKSNFPSRMCGKTFVAFEEDVEYDVV